MIIASHIGFISNIKSAGAITGTITYVISIKSKINPSKNIKSITIKILKYISPGNDRSASLINASPSRPLKTREKIVAPISKIKIILVIVIVSFATLKQVSILILFFTKASIVAPTAPSPAASVGVAMPKIIDPNTPNINEIGARN